MQVELDTSYSVKATVRIVAVEKAKLVIDGHPVTVEPRHPLDLNLNFEISPQTRQAEPVSYEIQRENRDA